MSLDPMVVDTQSPYAYVANDPINNLDPSGLATYTVTASLNCFQERTFTNGLSMRTTLFYDCVHSKIKWSIRFLSANIGGGLTIIGEIVELGMAWDNSRVKGTQHSGGHHYEIGMYFHGIFPKVTANTRISFLDEFLYPVVHTGGEKGVGYTVVAGHIRTH